MTKEETKKAIEIMQAYVDGKEIEVRYRNGWGWSAMPSWDWSESDYRIKPQPKVIPWTAETAPFPLALRKKHWEKGIYLLFNVLGEIVESCSTNYHGDGHYKVTFEELAEPDSAWEQRDGSPCGQVVEGGEDE